MNGNPGGSRSPKRFTGEKTKRSWTVAHVLLGLSMMSNYWLLSTRTYDLWSVVSSQEDAMLLPQFPVTNTTTIIKSEMMSARVENATEQSAENEEVNAIKSVESNVAKMAAVIPSIGEATPRVNNTVNMLFGMKGAKEDFLDEWGVSLKAILLNAPLDSNLHIHIVANEVAVEAVEKRIRRDFGLEGSRWRNQITITVYNVEMRIPDWSTYIRKAIRENNKMDGRVTIGGYFRLLAYTVIPASVGSVIYLDPDVVIMANLNDIWKYVDSEKVIQMATRQPCTGFMILNMAKFDGFWEGLNSLPNITHGGDQSLVTEFIKQFPDEVGDLPERWDGHLGHGFKHAAHRIISKRRYGIGFLHFQGARRAGETFYNNQGLTKHCAFACNATADARKTFKSTWGLADYYVQITWAWLKYYGASSIAQGHHGYPLRFEVIDTGTGEPL